MNRGSTRDIFSRMSWRMHRQFEYILLGFVEAVNLIESASAPPAAPFLR